MIVFNNPDILWLLMLLPGMPLFFFWGWRAKKANLEIFKLNLRKARQSQIKKAIIATLLTGLIILSIAGPMFAVPKEIDRGQGKTGEIMILVDVTKSMAATPDPFLPNRLERAKLLAVQIIESFPQAKIAVCGFTSLARCHTPFLNSQDSQARHYLIDTARDVLDINSVPGFGSDIGQALIQAVKHFSNSTDSKIIVLMSDGEPFTGDNKVVTLEAALALVLEKKIKIISVGIGEKEGAPIPLYDKEGKFAGKYVQFKGGIYISKLEEALLREAALKSGGKYFHESAVGNLIPSIADSFTPIPVLITTDDSQALEDYSYKDISQFFLIPIAVLWIVFARYYLRG